MLLEPLWAGLVTECIFQSANVQEERCSQEKRILCKSAFSMLLPLRLRAVLLNSAGTALEGKGWIFADELQVGDKLQKANGRC